jgi:hypothetical protein
MSTADGGGRRKMSEGMSFSLSFHQPVPGPTGAHWLDDLPDLTCKDSTRQHALDDPLLSCKQWAGGRWRLSSVMLRGGGRVIGS